MSTSSKTPRAAVASDVLLPDGQSYRPDEDTTHHESTPAVVAAVVANIAVGIVKFIAAGITGSSAMISEGIHSIVDSGNGLLILFGMKRSSRPADVEHPFGYSHELYFWTMVVAVMIFALGGGLSIYEGINHLLHADPSLLSADPTMNYIVIIAAMIIEGVSLRVAIKNFNAIRQDTAPLAFIREAKDPSLFTVVLEDMAAELGLLIALLGVFFGHLLKNPYFDGAASLLIGVLLCAVAGILLKETKGLLIGEGLKAVEVQRVEAIVERHPSVIECGRILSLYLGPRDMLLTMDVTFKKECTRDDIMAAIDTIEGRIVAAFPQTTRIFIESESIRFTYEQSQYGEKLGTSVRRTPTLLSDGPDDDSSQAEDGTEPRPGLHRVV